MNLKSLLIKIKRRLARFLLEPIRVFVFHQVSEEFDPTTMWECDWTELEQFKRNIISLKEKYTFISLQDAHLKLQRDRLRFHKYAALTCDDGWASVLSVLPWLQEQRIPLTLFLNPAYLLQQETRENGMDKLLTIERVKEIVAANSLVTIASHGWNHAICSEQDEATFQKNVDDSVQCLKSLDGYVSFFAYPCGKHTREQDAYLLGKNVVPVYCDGDRNCKDKTAIHRECIDYSYLNL